MSLATWKLKKIASKIPTEVVILLIVCAAIGAVVSWFSLSGITIYEDNTSTITISADNTPVNTDNISTNESVLANEAFEDIIDSAFDMMWVSMIVVMLLSFVATIFRMGRY